MPTVIESNGLTSLVQVGSNYFLYPVGTSAGPQLRMSGAAVTAGQFGPWMPIGAEQVASGYQVAWQFGTADQYIVWTLDSIGNFLSQGAVTSGNSLALESLEASFQQNLNNDLTTGIVTTVIESNGSTSLVQGADNYFLYPVGGSSGPQLRFGGEAVTTGEFGAWTPIGAEQTASGYQVAWKFGSADQYIVWTTDVGGNYLSQSAVVPGSSWIVQSLESGFDQDLNGDGMTGPLTTLIEASGSTSLAQVADAYFLYQGAGSSGPQLRFSGAYVAAGQFSAWTPIGAEQVGSVYEVAWKNGAADQYLEWTVDGSGNYITQGSVVSGSTWWVQSFESGLHQDLNNDGTIGPVTTTIEASGTATLVQVADAFFVNPGSSGPPLLFGGTYVAAGQFGAWTPIGAEQTVGGYEVAWKNGAADQYLVWNTDSSGRYLSQSAVMAGASPALQSLEASFQQDLNGDGSVAVLTTTIEASGSTALTQVGNAYRLDAVGGLAGPLLSYGGAYVTAGQFGSWTPLGAEWTGSGYQIAWKMAGVDQYTVWNTDSSGNYLSQTPTMFGSSSGLEVFEPNLHQDINGDGLIGVPTSAFDIDVSYSGDPAYQSYFTAAAQRWEQVITGDLPGFNVPGYGFIDDLHITASVSSIDGQGGILGQASPEYYRVAGGQPITGFMTFDSADLAGMASNGTLLPVILHEMGHILGIGTMWSYDGLVSGSQYFGSHALLAYQLLSGNPSATSVPLETGGGAGTAGAHWSEAVFGNELMTGFISGLPDPLSTVTIGSLQDMGYTVNYSMADSYTLPGHLAAGGPDGASTYADPAQSVTGPGSGAAGTSDIALFVADEDGHGHSQADPPPANLALMTNYMASSFVPSAGESAVVAAAQPSDQQLLAHPVS